MPNTTLYEMCPSQMFRIEGELYYFREIKGDKAVCEKEDGTIVYLSGNLIPDDYRPSRFERWFNRLSPIMP